MALWGDAGTHAEAGRLKHSLATQMYGPAVMEAASASMKGADGEEVERSYLEAVPPESNVVGFGYGTKWTASSVGADEAVRVYVRAKLPRRDVPSKYRVPDEVDGVPTDVIAVGHIRFAFPRPTPAGVSGGHRDIDFGTLGCLVEDGAGATFILSNNHVLANLGTTTGDPILEPGRIHGGAANPPIALLSKAVPLLMNGPKNDIDAAIARVSDPQAMTPDIRHIGRVARPTLMAAKNMSVTKSGALTHRTYGMIEELTADIGVGHPPHGVAYFHQQLAVRGVPGAFADLGDSGSLLLDALSLRPVGLVFAVANGLAYCNYIDKVIGALGVTIL